MSQNQKRPWNLEGRFFHAWNLSSDDVRSSQAVHLAAHHRLLRPQVFTGPHQVAHFALFALVSGGRASDGSSFEFQAIATHLHIHLKALRAYLGSSLMLRVIMRDFSKRDRFDALEVDVLVSLRQNVENLIRKSVDLLN